MRALPCALVAQIVFVAAPVTAYAIAWSPDDRRILGDPSFLPTAGEVSGSFEYTYSASLYDGKPNASLYPNAFDRSTNAFLPALQFGVTDDITVFGSLGFGNSRNRENFTEQEFILVPRAAAPLVSQVTATPPTIGIYDPGLGGLAGRPQYRTVTVRGVNQFRAIGADNPVLGLDWRMIDQRSAPVSVDVIGSYAPDIFQGRTANVQQTGSFASGGQAGAAEIAVSREMRGFTARVFGTFSYEGRRNQVNPSASVDLRSAPHPSYEAGLQTQTRLLPWLAFNAGVSARQAMRYDRFALSPDRTIPETIKPAGLISPCVGLEVPLLNRHIVAEVTYRHDFINNEALELPYGAGERYYKQEENLYAARILFAFGGAPLPLPGTNESTPSMAGPAPQPGRTYLVFFDWDRADLTARARQIVAQAAQAAAHATTRIEVDGYTDLSGTEAYNQRLSVRRAHSVQAELVRDGIAAGDISIHGFGEANPLVQTAAGMREPQNRRVEILLR